MKNSLFLVGFLSLATQQTAQAQPEEIWRGVYLFGQSDANLRQLRDSLHVNIVQYSTGYGDPRGDSVMLANGFVGVINQDQILATLSQAQRMVYTPASPGHESSPTFHMTHAGAKAAPGGALTIKAGQDIAPGIILSDMNPSPVPHDSRYQSTDYYATLYFKLPDATPSTPAPVARFTAACQTHGSIASYDIMTSDSVRAGLPRMTSLHFSTVHAGGGQCRNVDITLYWYGKISLNVDSIVVEDGIAYKLFSHAYDAEIDRVSRKDYALPAHRYFYLMDEPDPVSLPGFKYVADRIRRAGGNGSVTAMNGYVQQFTREAGATGLLVDWYFLTSDIPHPSLRHNDRLAREAGIAPWNADTYQARLQGMVERYISKVLAPAAEATHSQRMFLVQVLQFHGIIPRVAGQYRSPGAPLRPPSPSELRLQCGIGLAYGAKGVIGFPYGTSISKEEIMPGLISPVVRYTKEYPRGTKMNHRSDFDTAFGKKIWTGYAEKWKEVAAIYARLARLSHILIDLRWKGSTSWSNAFTAGDGTRIISHLSTKRTGATSDDDTAFVESGQFSDHMGRTYVILVNRRCGPTDSRGVSVWFSGSVRRLRVMDMERDKGRILGPGKSFLDTLRPGDFRVYRVEEVGT